MALSISFALHTSLRGAAEESPMPRADAADSSAGRHSSAGEEVSSLLSTTSPLGASSPWSLADITGLGAAPRAHDATTRHLVHGFFAIMGQELARFEREVHYLANLIKYPPPQLAASSTLRASSPESTHRAISSSPAGPSPYPRAAADSSPASLPASSPESAAHGESAAASVSAAAACATPSTGPFEGRTVTAIQLLEQSALLHMQASMHADVPLDALVESVRNLLWTNGEKLKKVCASRETPPPAE
ncbi:zinc finger, C3HC4 type (RING finger) domain-containing protein [Besnoitia besnoiti]|uniref:Zinc finger, C3HC4 type (RING finger) domain-containing protein n=1 Tax=Besnoitia besnoiti TaxID=94643 RepID=A0A2A9M6X7_BESBE|nr:zinc finger, C3HC4 type (RING finger) domain-containing protein [Besnoitia besnoiti]PFH31387.1 zinc finger, C3HC4 type (RING finger) domain-containing protein [Besnoitia besnoiti]